MRGAAPPIGGDGRAPPASVDRPPPGEKLVAAAAATHLHGRHSGKAPFHQQVESNESERRKVVEPSGVSCSGVCEGRGKRGEGGGAVSADDVCSLIWSQRRCITNSEPKFTVCWRIIFSSELTNVGRIRRRRNETVHQGNIPPLHTLGGDPAADDIIASFSRRPNGIPSAFSFFFSFRPGSKVARRRGSLQVALWASGAGFLSSATRTNQRPTCHPNAIRLQLFSSSGRQMFEEGGGVRRGEGEEGQWGVSAD